MKNVYIIVDSFASRTKKHLDSLGAGLLPLQITIDEKHYEDGVDLDFKKSMQLIEKAKSTSTSQPNPSVMEEMFKQGLKIAKKVIYISMGSKMSSAFSTATAISKDFNGEVEVWDSSLIGPGFERMIIWLQEKINKENTPIKEAKKIFENYNKKIITWVLPENMAAIKAGGRVKSGAKFLMSKMNMIPIIRYQDSHIDIKGVRRGFGKSVSKVLERMIEEIGQNNIDNYDFFVMESNREKTLNIAINKFEEAGISVKTEPISTAIAIQSGIGSLGITAIPKKIED